MAQVRIWNEEVGAHLLTEVTTPDEEAARRLALVSRDVAMRDTYRDLREAVPGSERAEFLRQVLVDLARNA